MSRGIDDAPVVSTAPSRAVESAVVQYAGFAESPLSPLDLVNALLRHWRAVVLWPLAAALLTSVIVLIVPPWYTARTTFVPETRSRDRLPSGVAALAGQFGFALGPDASESPRFYTQVARSRELLERLLKTRYPDPRLGRDPGDSVPLRVLLKVRGDSLPDSLARGVRRLGKLIDASADLQTNIVTLDVTTRYPRLSAAVANDLVAYINEFNTKQRQSQAGERRKFVQQRLVDGERELHDAEDTLRRFYERNRFWQQSPELVSDEGRLRRQVEVRQEVYLTLRREYEQARIEEVNDTPVITVIDPAVAPQRRSSPQRILIIALAFVVAGVMGVFWALGADYLDRMGRTEDVGYRDFRGLVRRVRRELRDALPGARPGARTP
jgi:uncharacterized protein involved in exopolysaccharide biosynthesis